MRGEQEQNPKSFAGTFWVSYFQLNENEVFVRACGRARSQLPYFLKISLKPLDKKPY
jgi:hypothetical protein